KDLCFSYGEKEIIRNLSFLVRRRERVMILGPNGSGKSTLMKLINSRLTPSSGKIVLGYNVKIGYYDQENRGLTESNTVFSEMRGEYPDKTDLELRSTLALFLFGAEDMDKQISTLSGGERARLTLAKLILKKVNLLIMDEPTNHLDIGSADALENALLAFDGTIVAVSHDRYFVNKIATRIIEIGEKGENLFDCTLEDYDNAYDEYMRIREMRKAKARESISDAPKISDSKADYEKKKRENAERRANERKLEKAKEKVAALEKELVQLEEELFTSAASNYVRAAEIDSRKAEIEEELLSLYEIIM
ncbi:MAG: ABC-F family ATP-binding cassette domain-containing protein, partial [Clostridia bacterium]|nr:ABC-F family ATP-binding cassette domain-containing protein [Clostridia bacterium]